MSSPLISVIIPVYNVEKYLKECLDSVLNQTLRNIEVICVDDESTDNSLAILREYEKLDQRIIVIQQQNSGAGVARNKGINIARGDYLSFLDSDDWYPNNQILEKLYNNAKRENMLISGGSVILWNGDKKITRFNDSLKGNVFEKEGIINYIDYQYDYAYQRFIYSRKMLIENAVYFPPYRRFQDPPFFVKAMIVSSKFYAISEPTYCYRYTPKHIEWNEKKVLDLIEGLIDNLKLSSKNNLSDLHKLTVYRCEHEFAKVILNSNIISYNIISELFLLNSNINSNLLKYDKFYIVLPLRVIIEKLLNCDAKCMKEKDFISIQKDNIILGNKINDIENSYSFRIGRTITFFPRKIRGAIRCYNEHGFVYTIERIIKKIRNTLKG